MFIKRIRKRYYSVGVALLATCFVLTCDKPTEPVGTSKDYRAYFWSAVTNDSNWYFAYHPLTNRVDSMYLPYSSYPVVSADGNKLYIRDDVNSSVAVLDTDSFAVIDRLQYNGVRAVSPDNKLLLAFRMGEGFHLIKTSDYSSIYHDSTLRDGKFSHNAKRFYSVSNDSKIHRLEISDSVYESAQFSVPFGEVKVFEPSPDESKIFFYLRTGVFSHHFAVYDIAADSVVFTEQLVPGYGGLAVTPNGKYVFYSNPGTMIGPTSGTPWVTVYSVESNEVLTRITTTGLLEPPYHIGVPLNSLSVTPDGRWLVVLPAKSFDFVFAIDVRKMTIDNYIHFPQGFLLGGLTCQNSP